MATHDIKLKKYVAGTTNAWEDAYPETTHTQIVATGTPSSTTFLRGDGAWAVPAGSTTAGSAEKVTLQVRFGEAVSKGDPVYISGYHGSTGPVIMSKAKANDSAKMPAFGLADDDYAENATGYAVSIGVLEDIDTDSYTVGDTLYVAPTGGLTDTKPTGSNLIQNVGTVSRSNLNNGSIEVTATGRSNDVPNLTTGKLWVGSANNTIESATLHLDETNNRLGIGTTSPVSLLEVKAENGSTGTITVGGGNTTVTAVGEVNAALDFRSNDASVNNTNNIAGRIASITETTNGAYAGLGFYTFQQSRTPDLQEAMRINNDGNVGIGTTNPKTKLNVASGTSAAVTPTLGSAENSSAIFTNSVNAYGLNVMPSGSGDVHLQVQRFDASTSVYDLNLQPSGGNVGIGTTSPGEKLQVEGDVLISGTGGTIGTSGAITNAYLKIGTTLGFDPNQMLFSSAGYINSTQWLALGGGGDGTQTDILITSDHKVGIGTTTPSEKLDVDGNIAVSGTVDGVDIAAFKTDYDSHTHTTAEIYEGTGTTQLFTNAGTSSPKLKIEYLPDAVFDSLYFQASFAMSGNNVTNTNNLTNVLQTAMEHALTNRKSASALKGYYFVTTTSAGAINDVESSDTAKQATNASGSYSNFYFRWDWNHNDDGQSSTDGSNNNLSLYSSGYLEIGDWFVVENVFGSGTSSDPYYIHFSIVQNTYEVMVGASEGIGPLPDTAGSKGLVPSPGATDYDKFLRGDGTWTTDSTKVSKSGDTMTDTLTISAAKTTDDPLLKLVSTATGDGDAVIELEANDTGEAGIIFKNPDNTNSSGWFLGSGDAFSEDFYLYDRQNGGVRLAVGHDGNVGIGTNSPHTKLTTKVGLASFGNVTTNTDNQVRVGQYVDGSGAGRLYLYDENNTNDVLINTNGTSYFNGGNVGIGTTNPSVDLHIKGSTAAVRVDRDATSYGGTYQWAEGGTLLWEMKADQDGGNNNSLQIATASAPTVTFEQNGRVGIGTTSPGSTLDVNGDIQANRLYDRNNTAYYVDPAGTSELNAVNANRVVSENETTTPDEIGNIKIARLHASTSSTAIGNIDNLETFILSKTDGGYGSGTKPSGSNNAFGVISLQTHTGDYFSQIGFESTGNNAYLRSASNATSFGSWEKIWTAGNDGSGSGLDADKLDNIEATSFLRSDTADTASGDITFTGNIVADLRIKLNTPDNNIAPLNIKSDAEAQAIHIEETGTGNSESWQIGVNGDGDLNFYNSGSSTPTIQFYDSNSVFFPENVTMKNLQMTSNQNRTKIRIWSGSTYGMGMHSGFTYGGLGASGGEYAMTFQMNDDTDRGFWWGHSVHTTAQGAMALTTDDELTVANAIRVGYGEADTTTPADNVFDINGNVTIAKTTTGGQNQIQFKEAGTTKTQLTSNYGDNKFYLYHEGDNRMVINSSGQVGIGTTSPTEKLTVDGAGIFDGNAAGRVLYLRGDGNIIQFQGASNQNVWEVVGREANFYIYNNDLSKRAIYIEDSTNYIGLNNNTSPSHALDVFGEIRGYVSSTTNASKLWSENGSTGQASLELKNSEGHFRTITDGGAYYVYDQTDGAHRFYIDTSGKVGIGTSNPQGRLHIIDDSTKGLEFEEITGGVMRMLAYDRTNTVEVPLEIRGDSIDFETNATRRFLINDTGAAVTGNLTVSGDLTINGTTTTMNTTVSTTDQWTVTNAGTDVAAIINQTGTADILDVRDNGTSVFKVKDGGDVEMKTDSKFTVGASTTVNEAKIILDASNGGHPQIGLAENNDASWALGVDDNDNSFKIHGAASSTIPTIGNLSTPHLELDTTGNLWLQKRIYLTSNAFIEYNSTNDSIDFFFN